MITTLAVTVVKLSTQLICLFTTNKSYVKTVFRRVEFSLVTKFILSLLITEIETVSTNKISLAN